MEKELRSCTGVPLLRADLKGNGHLSPICQKGWDGCALLGHPTKGHPCRIFILFPLFYYIISTTYQKLETCFALFLDFRTVCFLSIHQIDYSLVPTLFCRLLYTD